jgi:hypothetical protein
MKQLDHQSSEPLKGSRNSDTWAHFDQNALGGVDEDLEFSGLVDRGVEKGEEALETKLISKIKTEIKRGAMSEADQTWCVISGRASLMSLFILRIIPMCSSLFRSEYFSSRPLRPPCEGRYVSRLAFDRTTIKRWVSLSFAGIGTCCSATSCGSSGGGHDWVPASQGWLLSAGTTVEVLDHREGERVDPMSRE